MHSPYLSTLRGLSNLSMKLRFFLLVLSLSLFLFGCKKDEEDRDATVAKDHSIANAFFNDLYRVVDESAENTAGIRALECVQSIVVDTLSSPKSILIDFGNDPNCTDQLGVNRRGQIVATFTGRYRNTGTVITIMPMNYRVDGYALSGTKTVINEGLNPAGQLYFSVSVDNGQVTHPDGDYTFSWNSNTTRTWVEGNNTWWHVDDEYQVIGTASGVDRSGNPFTVSTQSPMRFTVVCPWITRGVLKISPEGKLERILDYGNGSCDNDAVFSIGDYQTNILI